MDYKELLVKVNNEIPETYRKSARAFILQEKKKDTNPAFAWSVCLDKYGNQKPGSTDRTGQTKQDRKKAEGKQNRKKTERQPVGDQTERVQGEVIGENLTTENINGLDMNWIENRVYQCLDDFMTECNIDDMAKAPQRQFSAFSMYVGRHLFKGTDILKDKTIYNNGSAMSTNCQRYDLKKIITVLNFYIFICTKYNKAFTLDGGAYFCGVSDNYITQHKEELTLLGFDPNKKAEQTIACGLLDGKINPTGSIAWLNYNAKWSTPNQQAQPQQVNVSVYPVLNTMSTPKIENKG